MTKTGKTVACALAFIMLGAGVCAACTDGYTNWNKFGWFGKPGTEKPADDNGEETSTFSGVTDGEGNELTSGTTYGIPLAMVYSLSSEESVTAKDGISIEAVVTPSVAVNKLVDYSVSFANAESEWAGGKEATDFITVEPESDGSANAKVFCHGAFGEQIIITVASRSNPEITAACTVDYAQRVTSATLSIGDELIYDIFNENTFDVDINIGSDTAGKGGVLALNVTLSDTYTIAQDFEQSVIFSHGYEDRAGIENGGYNTNLYVAKVEHWSAGFTTGDDYNEISLGGSYYFDMRLFSDLDFHTYSTYGNGSTTSWSERDVSTLKLSFDAMLERQQDYKDRNEISPNAILGILWDCEVTLSSQYITYTLNGMFIWASVSGWEDVTGIQITVDGNGATNVIF